MNKVSWVCRPCAAREKADWGSRSRRRQAAGILMTVKSNGSPAEEAVRSIRLKKMQKALAGEHVSVGRWRLPPRDGSRVLSGPAEPAQGRGARGVCGPRGSPSATQATAPL